MADPSYLAALQQHNAAAAAQYAANPALYQAQLLQYQQQYQQTLAAHAAQAAAAHPRAVPAKTQSRKSQPLPSRQSSRRRDEASDDDDDDEFEDYSHLLTPAERERRKKRLVGTGDRESDDDFQTPRESSSSSEEEESSSEEEEDESEGEVTTSSEEDFGYGPPKKDRDAGVRRRRDSDEDASGSDGDRPKKSKSKANARNYAVELKAYMRAVEVPLRRQLLRFFSAVAASYAHKQETAKAAAAGQTAPASSYPPLPQISLSLAEWGRPEDQRMAFCELLNLCPVEAKADTPEAYHYRRDACEQGINFYCNFQPDRPQPARPANVPNVDWVKRFEDRVKQWFALEPIGQYMQTIPALKDEEKNSDALYQSATAAVAQNPDVDVNQLLAQTIAASAATATATAAAPASAAAAADGADEKAPSGKAEKKGKGKKGKGKKAAAAAEDSDAEEETASAGKKRGRKGKDKDAEGGSRKKQKKAAADDEESGDEDSKDEKKGPREQPSDPATARTLFLQQLDVQVRRQMMQLVASSMPTRLVQGHRENFAAKFGEKLIALTFVRICELAGITPKPFDAKTVETQIQHYFTFKLSSAADKVRAPAPTFVHAFQNAVREWLKTAPVQALMASEYWIPAAAEQQAEDAEFTKAQADARAVAAVEYLYALPGSAAVVKAGNA